MHIRFLHAAIAIYGILAASLAYADVAVYRSTEMNQTGSSSFEFTCVLEYSGIHPSHEFYVNLKVLRGGVEAGPSTAMLGPGSRNVNIEDETGQWTFDASVRGRTIRARRTLYLKEDPKGTVYSCQGGAYNLTTGETLPSTRVVDFNL